MQVSRPGIAAALTAPKGQGPLIERFMRDAEPLFRIAESGEYPLAEAERFNLQNVAVAIATASLAPVNGIITLSSSQDELRADWCRERQYRTFLSLALKTNRRDDFDTRFGAESISSLVDPLWNDFGAAYVAAFRRTHEDFLGQFDMAMESDVAYGPLVAVTYAAGYAAYGDDAAYAQMRGLVRLLPWTVPIGMPEGTGRKWLLLAQ